MSETRSDTTSPYEMQPGRTLPGGQRVVGPSRARGLALGFELEGAGGERLELLHFPLQLFGQRAEAHAFANASQRWCAVRSPAVNRVREVYESAHGDVLVISEFPQGVLLRDTLARNGRLAQERVLALGAELAAGLAEIHAHGLVHGDMKPDTVALVGPSERALILDGGQTPALWSAKHLGERTALIGTPFYAPVEQFGGDSPDVQTDVYNLATLLFEAIAGVLPWPGKSFLEVFQAKLERGPRLVRERAPEVEIGAALEQCLARGLAARREDRWSTAREFGEALAEAGREPARGAPRGS